MINQWISRACPIEKTTKSRALEFLDPSRALRSFGDASPREKWWRPSGRSHLGGNQQQIRISSYMMYRWTVRTPQSSTSSWSSWSQIIPTSFLDTPNQHDFRLQVTWKFKKKSNTSSLPRHSGPKRWRTPILSDVRNFQIPSKKNPAERAPAIVYLRRTPSQQEVFRSLWKPYETIISGCDTKWHHVLWQPFHRNSAWALPRRGRPRGAHASLEFKTWWLLKCTEDTSRSTTLDVPEKKRLLSWSQRLFRAKPLVLKVNYCEAVRDVGSRSFWDTPWLRAKGLPVKFKAQRCHVLVYVTSDMRMGRLATIRWKQSAHEITATIIIITYAQ